MKLSQMVTNANSEQEIQTEQNEQRSEGHIQSTVDDGQRSCAADCTPEEAELLKALADPAITPAPGVGNQNIDNDTQAELDAIIALVN